MRTAEASGIIRTRKRNNYTVVDKTPFEDERLTWAARGLLAYLLTKPDDWQVRVNDLLKKAPKCGRDQLRGILAEIEAYGYLTRDRVWNPQTKRIDWETVVHEAPQPASEEKIAKLESRHKRRKKEQKQSTEIQAIDQCPEKQSTEIQYIEKQHIENPSTYQELKVPTTESTKRERAKRDAPAPKQSSMDSYHEAVTIYKELSGNRNIAPVVVSLIASKVTDMELWRRVVTAWCSQYRRDNFDGMFDWYEHPEKMNRKNGKVQLEPDRPSPPPYQPRDHKPTDTKRLAELRAKARESGK